MCGRILIHLNEELTAVDDVGCVVYERDHSLVKYIFYSLVRESDRESI